MTRQETKTVVTAMLVTALAALVFAQQAGYPTRGNVTRMDMAPKFKVQSQRPPSDIGGYSAEDARRACEAKVSEREVRTALLVQELQNSEGGIPILRPFLGSMAIQAAREQAKKDCEHAGEPVETLTVWGPGK